MGMIVINLGNDENYFWKTAKETTKPADVVADIDDQYSHHFEK